MKRFVAVLSSALAIVIMCITMVGCTLFTNTPNSSGKIENLPNSSTVGSNISFTEQKQETRQLLSAKDAAYQVARANGVLEVKNSSSSSRGSAVVVDVESDKLAEGEYYVITCHHMISGGGNMTLSLPDANMRNLGDPDYNKAYQFTGVVGSQVYADNSLTLVGGDKETDIAVLKIRTAGKAVDIDTAKMPISDYQMAYGEEVFAIGNPSGYAPMTFMAGNISYLNRKVKINEVGFMNLVQIDAMINHGSSGGGLYNYYGELIGITNGGNDEFRGINYAIPFDGETGYVEIAKQLMATATESNYGYISGRWNLGVTITEGTYSFTGESFVKVISVEKNSNAHVAGVKAGDIIIGVKHLKGEETISDEITTQASFANSVDQLKKDLKMGDSFELIVGRNINETVTLTFKIEKQYIFCDTGIYPETDQNN